MVYRRVKTTGGKFAISILVLTVSFILLFLSYYFIKTVKYNGTYNNKTIKSGVSLRKFPFPYKAALSIAHDIDLTTGYYEFIEIQKFLHTDNITTIGKGIDLDIGGSFLFYENPEQTISYFNITDDERKNFIKLIKSGYLDFIHSYGKKPDFIRADALRALTELNSYNLHLDVWVDHTKTIDNFGNDVTRGEGDLPSSSAYHADITIPYGIKFVWMGRVTQVVGQGTPVKPSNYWAIYDNHHSYATIKNSLIELAKQVLGVLGNHKYALHGNNDLVNVVSLDDGQKVFEFMRYDGSWVGVASTGDNAKGLPYVISERNLNRLIEQKGFMIVYTHLGENSEFKNFFPEETVNAFRLLSNKFNSGEIYVTTTSRLLNYYVNHKYLEWEVVRHNNLLNIQIKGVDDPVKGYWVPTVDDLQGLTFYIPDNTEAQITVNGRIISSAQHNAKDFSGRESISVPIKSMIFPPSL